GQALHNYRHSFCLFFFSSRRRHTRWPRDWSSDVCSSDLFPTLINAGNGGASQQLFSLAQTDPIRTYVSVPEAYAPSIRAGLGARSEERRVGKEGRARWARWR